MLLMIDNYDSFTFNLVQYFGELGEDVRVFRNDEITSTASPRAARRARALARAVLAGRGRHLRRGDPRFRRQAADPRRVPRPPGDRRGARRQGRARRAADARQGRPDPDGRGVYRGCPSDFGRALSLAGDRAGQPAAELEVTATARTGDHGRSPSRAGGRRRRSKACSSIPNRSSASMATRC